MSYLERLQAKTSTQAGSEPAKGSKGAFAPFEGDRTGRVGELSVDLAAGLQRLRSMSTPRAVRPEVWTRVVRDACGLVDAGWAAKALALGWSELDLLGAVTDAEGDPLSDGLAVWLAGRKLLAIEATLAVVRDGNGWSYYHRREQAGATLLWNLGR